MEDKSDESDKVDALCKECGHGFKVYIDRITRGEEPGSQLDKKFDCPVCGCGECRIGN